jgi:hypothetical protein
LKQTAEHESEVHNTGLESMDELPAIQCYSGVMLCKYCTAFRNILFVTTGFGKWITHYKTYSELKYSADAGCKSCHMLLYLSDVRALRRSEGGVLDARIFWERMRLSLRVCFNKSTERFAIIVVKWIDPGVRLPRQVLDGVVGFFVRVFTNPGNPQSSI